MRPILCKKDWKARRIKLALSYFLCYTKNKISMALKEVTFDELNNTLQCSIEGGGYSASLTVLKELQLRDVTDAALKNFLMSTIFVLGLFL